MSRRDFKRVANDENIPKSLTKTKKISVGEHDQTRLHAEHAIIKDLTAQLQVRAERMRIQARKGVGEFGDAGHSHIDNTKTAKELGVIPDQEKNIKGSSTIMPSSTVSPSRIPWSVARKKRHEAKGGQRQSKLHSGTIQNYRPGYTWSKGGRVKELRIRCLARKYIHIWTRNVFGRVHPYIIRLHHSRCLLRNTFKVWYTMWWGLRKEWRLMIRAECQYRYTIWLKVFQSWKEFVVAAKVKNSKRKLAVAYDRKRLEQLAFSSWRQHVISQRSRHALRSKAEQFYMSSVLRKTWNRWQEGHALLAQHQLMTTASLQFWSHRMQSQHFMIWRKEFMERQELNRKMHRAAVHHNGYMRAQCFQSLKSYVQIRKEKCKLKAFASGLHHDMVKQKYLAAWYQHYRLRLSVVAHKEHMEALAQRVKLRQAFCHWKHYIHLKHEEYQIEAMASHHYRRQLLVLGFSAFHLRVVQRKVGCMQVLLADQLRQKQLLRMHWNAWIVRCDNNEDLRLISSTRKAQEHHRMNQLRMTFYAFAEYTRWRRHRKNQLSRADAYYYVRVLPQYLFRMRVFVQIMTNKRENQEKAYYFRRENLQARFYYMWTSALVTSKDCRMMERMSIIHYDDIVLKRYFSQWKARFEAATADGQTMAIACQHYYQQLSRKHLCAWRNHITNQKKSLSNEVKSAKHYYLSLLKMPFARWKEYHMSRRQKSILKNKADAHYRFKMYRLVLSGWMQHMQVTAAVKSAADIKYKQKSQELLRDFFIRWKHSVHQDIHERRMVQTADIHHNRQMLVKVLTCWHRYSAIHAYKKSETQHWVESAREELNTGKLRRAFAHWRQMRDSRILYRLKHQQAEEHHSHNVCRRVFVEWKEYIKLSQRKRLLMRQCAWFHNTRLTAKFFSVWKQQHAEAAEQANKTAVALWHWSLVLQKKCLDAVHEYVKVRKSKALRMAKAMEIRRQRLLRDGTTKWLVVAQFLADLRSKMAAQTQAKNAYSVHVMVQKCARHWRHLTAKRKADRSRSGVALPQRKPAATKLTWSVPIASTSPSRPTVSRSGRGPIVDRDDVLINQNRARPRRPAFLIESLKRAGLHMYAEPEDSNDGTFEIPPSDPQDLAPYMAANEPRTVRDAVSQFPAKHLPLQQSHNTHFDGCTVEDSQNKVQFSTTLEGDCKPSDRLQLNDGVLDRMEVGEDLPRPCVPPASNYIPNLSMYNNAYVAQSYDLNPSPLSERHAHVDTMHTVKAIESKSNAEFTACDSYNIRQNEDTFAKNSGASNIHLNETKKTVITETEKLIPVFEQKGFTKQMGITLLTPADFESKSKQLLEPDPERFIGSYPSNQTVSSQSSPESPLRNVVVGDHRLLSPMLFQQKKRMELDKLKKKSADGSEGNVVIPVLVTASQEIINIRDQLKSLEKDKLKLKSLQKQKKHLSDWIRDQEVKGQQDMDDDVILVMQELQEINTEVAVLKKSIEERKPICSRLRKRVGDLLQSITSDKES